MIGIKAMACSFTALDLINQTNREREREREKKKNFWFHKLSFWIGVPNWNIFSEFSLKEWKKCVFESKSFFFFEVFIFSTNIKITSMFSMPYVSICIPFLFNQI
jgi:hypothetical protein